MDFIAFCFAMVLVYFLTFTVVEAFFKTRTATVIMILLTTTFFTIIWASIGTNAFLNIIEMPNDHVITLILGIGFTIILMQTWRLIDELNPSNQMEKLFDWVYIHQIAKKGLWGYEYKKRFAFFSYPRKTSKGNIVWDIPNGDIIRETKKYIYAKAGRKTYRLCKSNYESNPSLTLKILNYTGGEVISNE